MNLFLKSKEILYIIFGYQDFEKDNILFTVLSFRSAKLLINYTLKFKYNILVSPKKFVSSRN